MLSSRKVILTTEIVGGLLVSGIKLKGDLLDKKDEIIKAMTVDNDVNVRYVKCTKYFDNDTYYIYQEYDDSYDKGYDEVWIFISLKVTTSAKYGSSVNFLHSKDMEFTKFAYLLKSAKKHFSKVLSELDVNTDIIIFCLPYNFELDEEAII